MPILKPLPLKRVRTILPTKKQWKSWSLPSKATFIGTIIAIISLAITIFSFWLPGIIRNELESKRLDGMLTSTLSGTQSLRTKIQTLYDMAKLRRDEKADIESVYLPGQLEDKNLLNQLLNDGVLFGKLTPSMQHKLPTFIHNRQIFISTLNPDKPDLEQEGTLYLLLLELDTEEACLKLEIQYQNRRIGATEHKEKFNTILDSQAREIMQPGK
jgi:hypothetical protein